MTAKRRSAGETMYDLVAFGGLPLPVGPANTYWEDLSSATKKEWADSAKLIVKAYEAAKRPSGASKNKPKG